MQEEKAFFLFLDRKRSEEMRSLEINEVMWLNHRKKKAKQGFFLKNIIRKSAIKMALRSQKDEK